MSEQEKRDRRYYLTMKWFLGLAASYFVGRALISVVWGI